MLKKVVAVAAATGGLVLAGAGVAMADGGANAEGAAIGSPGVLSGNVVQAPVNAPVNVCDTTVNLIGFLNLDYGDTACINA
ncbi:hypothetical protein GCM10010406_50450 [Streptomyces thermolineatus]|uniref:Chaplin domain-containing protein n=1 Tax=Streptomyces thermolineatus TaxID=44033 RepID=A0ABN3MSV5_9ACTN|nr:chaplin [Streptomyces sp. SCUT-3]PLW65619.1 chaplin [Streptomyces sp. DJ]QMV24107.1 DUF320 domain-containing protein [Streptomyces sp. SCUT-3]